MIGKTFEVCNQYIWSEHYGELCFGVHLSVLICQSCFSNTDLQLERWSLTLNDFPVLIAQKGKLIRYESIVCRGRLTILDENAP